MSDGENGRLVSLGMKLAVPFNHDPRLIPALRDRAGSIAELFIPAPLDVCGSFRSWTGPDPREYRSRIPFLVRDAARLGISVNMAINPPFVPPGDYGRIASFVREAVKDGVGSFTFGDLRLAGVVRDLCPDVELVASATAEIAHVTRARHWIRQVGVSRIVPARIVNKDLPVLSAMARLGVVIELIPNEQCLPACPYAFAHSMTIGARDSFDDSDYADFCAMCAAMKPLAPWEHYQTEIVPASIPMYEGIVRLIKLAGRDSTTSYILGEVDRFISLESDRTGFLGGYREPPEVLERVSGCDRVCEQCGFCRDVFVAVNPSWRRNAQDWLERVRSGSGRV